jgi:fumarylacetoacetate (FAA) hydrolase family protein
MEESDKTIEELEREIRRLSSPVEQNANKISREVVRVLIAFLKREERLPEGLILSIGAVLVRHVASAEQISKDIQELFDLVDQASSDISTEDTIKSVDI